MQGGGSRLGEAREFFLVCISEVGGRLCIRYCVAERLGVRGRDKVSRTKLATLADHVEEGRLGIRI